MRLTLTSIFIFCLQLFIFGQAKVAQPKQIEDADEHFNHKNYGMAIPIYKSELKLDPDNTKIKYKLGICYLNTRINRVTALNYFLDASTDMKVDADVYKYLGKAFMVNNKLEEAIVSFERFKELKPKQLDEANYFLKQCSNAKYHIYHPTNVIFQNLGKEINSPEPDYYPLVNKDESYLVYTSRRKENFGGTKVEMDGYRSSDIYYSVLVNGKWATTHNAGRLLNTILDEQAVGLNADGSEMNVYIDHIDKYGDLYLSKRQGTGQEFGKPKIFEGRINEKIESSGCLNEDGDILFFARKENLSETSDLYICRKLPTGDWAIPQKLPDNINSKYNEDFPFLSYDGKTLYFASDGPNSMGGFDIFKSAWDQKNNTFSDPENLGYPINSTDDDRNISVTADNSLAYLSAFRPNGFGDLDIYRVKFNENETVSRVYVGYVFFGDSIPSHQPAGAMASIIASNVMTGYEYTFTPHSRTGKYVMSLPEGLYKISIYADGYETLEDELGVSDIGRMNIEYNKNYLLLKKNEVRTLVEN